MNFKEYSPLSTKKVGFTTSFPVEVVFAAGLTPIDLNNIFINNNPTELVRYAELKGFPRNICAWIKGMYAVICRHDIDTVVGIIQGDCSNTHSLMEILKDEGKGIIPFSYSWDRDKEFINREISKLEALFGVTREQTEHTKRELDKVRAKLRYLDELTWKTNQVTAQENHYWLVSSSDFNTDYQAFGRELDVFLENIKQREPMKTNLRLGFIGVPPILFDIYSFLQECGASVVYNEVQRQFSMFYETDNIVEQYTKFTYPCDIFTRIHDIKTECILRDIDGLIAYTQSFCHRQLDIISLKKHIDIPILQLEADKPDNLDSRTKLRIESFVEMLGERD